MAEPFRFGAGGTRLIMTPADIVGTLAALCSMASFVPQIVKIRRDGQAESVSLQMYVVTVTGFCFWIGYGVMTRSWPVAASNTVCLILSGIVLGLKWRLTAK